MNNQQVKFWQQWCFLSVNFRMAMNNINSTVISTFMTFVCGKLKQFLWFWTAFIVKLLKIDAALCCVKFKHTVTNQQHEWSKRTIGLVAVPLWNSFNNLQASNVILATNIFETANFSTMILITYTKHAHFSTFTYRRQLLTHEQLSSQLLLLLRQQLDDGDREIYLHKWSEVFSVVLLFSL